MNDNAIAVVPAAGLGKRLGAGTNKTFLSILGKPVIVWTLEALSSVSVISEIVPVFKEQDIESGLALCRRYGLSKVRKAAAGGKERQDSVYNGLMHLNRSAGIVVIHDGARPLVRREVIIEAIKGVSGFDGAVAGVPVKDTIKEADAGTVAKTLERERLWAIQTPQAFKYDSIMKAYSRAMEEKFYATDDAALVERAGGKVRIIMGSYENIKITTHEDIEAAEFLLGRRRSIR